MKQFFFLSLLTLASFFSSAQLMRCDKTQVFDGQNEFVIHAILINDEVLTRVDTPKLPKEKVYEEIKGLGFNTVKILLNYKDFEIGKYIPTYKPESWVWLNKHIELAKKHDLKVILTLYVAPGGHQLKETNDELWLNSGHQNRLKNLWSKIAVHYKNEATIIGYDLLDSPSPKYSIGQWKQLAKSVVTSLRKAGDEHIVFLQNANFKNSTTGLQKKEELNFIFLKDIKNIVYDFHYYGGKAFSWQRIKGLQYNNDNEVYPDLDKAVYPNDLEVFKITEDNTRIGVGTSNLSYREGKKYLINDSSIVSVLPVIYSDKLMPGFAFYNNIVIQEFSPTGHFIRDMKIIDPNKIEGWEIETKDQHAKFKLIEDYGATLISVIRIGRVETPTRVYNENLRFVPKFGFYYSIGAQTITKSVNFEGESYLRFEFEKSPSGKTAGARNSEGTEKQLNEFITWSNKNNVPIIMGEYGTSNYSFKRNRGGDRYLNDMKVLIEKHKLNACFNSFDSEYFGLYKKDKKGNYVPKKAQIAVWAK